MKFLIACALIITLMGCTSSEVQQTEQIDAQEDWGITLSATDVTPAGLTIICKHTTAEEQGELTTGSPYWLQLYEDDLWQNVHYLPLEYDWTMEAWIIPQNDTTEWAVDWVWLYGELPSGQYRIAKTVAQFVDVGNRTEQIYYAPFEIA